MSLRYATIVNKQADGTGEDGEGGQRRAYTDTAFRAGNSSLGVGNQKRLNLLFKPAYITSGYDPKEKIKETIDHDSDFIEGNPDFSADAINGVNLNFKESPSFNISERIDSLSDKPLHGSPNIRVSKEDLNDPGNNRVPTKIEIKNRGFGSEYDINDMEGGSLKRAKIGMYLTKNKSIHDGGSKTRLGKSDPDGNDYVPLDRS